MHHANNYGDTTVSEQPVEGVLYRIWTHDEGEELAGTWDGHVFVDNDGGNWADVTAFAPLPTREQATEFKPQPQVKRYVVEVKGPHRKFTPMFLESVIESRLDAYICVKELPDPTQTPEFEALGRVVYLGMPYDTAELQKAFSDYSRSLEL